MRTIIAILGIVFGTFAHAQATVPPAASTYVVNLSWTASISCSATAPCTYTVYRAAASGTYSLIGTTASQTVTYTDSTVAAGTAYTYEIETVQAGANSAPSVPVAVTVPNVPNAPTVIIVTIAP
jgi:hypothetical protein